MIARPAALAGVLALGACVGPGPVETPGATRLGVQRYVAQREPWSFRGREGWLYRTPSAVIRTTVRDRAMRLRLPAFVELSQLHARSLVATLPEPDEPVETYMLGSRRGWETITRRLLGDRAGVYLAMEKGGFSVGSTGVFYDIGPKDSFTIAAHEGWHQLARSVLEDPIPVWLDEGIACYAEGFRWDDRDPDLPRFLPWANLERFDQLRDAYGRGTLIPLRELVTVRPQELMRTDRGADRVLTYYAQLWALVHFLRESDHAPGLARTIEMARDGRLLDAMPESAARALRVRRTGPGVLAVIAPGRTLDELDAAYTGFVGRIVGVGGRDAVVFGRSPLDPS